MRQANSLSFSNEPEELAVAIEAPWPSFLDNLKARFIIAVE